MKKLIFGMCSGLLMTVIYTQPILAADEIGKRHPGTWVKEATFLQVHTGCLQVWQCKNKEAILHDKDTNIRTTPPAKTTGVCNAGGGAVDSCNICAASAPKETCEWWLEKK